MHPCSGNPKPPQGYETGAILAQVRITAWGFRAALGNADFPWNVIKTSFLVVKDGNPDGLAVQRMRDRMRLRRLRSELLNTFLEFC
ncbi:hypothetical protein PGIGA_G00129940 [Pangasianodon gigas]|uniref:Uncharacterized protein n=1 Tax=Pangasianodon gigas TaxID=30993 RepID=A0ACC5XJD7_PANGG|nr:hypothetical protein [Pangasianodon gigas]